MTRQDSGGTVEWYGTDHLGSVRQVFDNSTGAVLASYTSDYDAFGKITGTPVDRYAYAGMAWDADLKLYFDNARMYDPTIGRFYSADPLGFATGDKNLYRYVGNKPTDNTDPSGLIARRPIPSLEIPKGAIGAFNAIRNMYIQLIQKYINALNNFEAWADWASEKMLAIGSMIYSTNKCIQALFVKGMLDEAKLAAEISGDLLKAFKEYKKRT